MTRGRETATLFNGMRLWLIGILAGCGSGGGFPDARVNDAAPPGTFSLDWAVTDEGGGRISCDTVGAYTVTVLTHNRAFAGSSTQVFGCPPGTGVSQALTPGTYDFEFELVGASETIATAPAQRGVEITAAGSVRLAPLTFQVVATGALALTVSTQRPAGNCAPTSGGGGGISSMQLRLVHAPSGVCEPAVLNIGAGAVSGRPASTYTVNCASPADGPCIDNDQAIRVASVPSGGYVIHILGKQAGASPNPVCWTNHDGIQVPPRGQTLSRPLYLAFQDMTAGCM